jgi:hypothetical protein
MLPILLCPYKCKIDNCSQRFSLRKATHILVITENQITLYRLTKPVAAASIFTIVLQKLRMVLKNTYNIIVISAHPLSWWKNVVWRYQIIVAEPIFIRIHDTVDTKVFLSVILTDNISNFKGMYCIPDFFWNKMMNPRDFSRPALQSCIEIHYSRVRHIVLVRYVHLSLHSAISTLQNMQRKNILVLSAPVKNHSNVSSVLG